jgi:hypothetical protein
MRAFPDAPGFYRYCTPRKGGCEMKTLVLAAALAATLFVPASLQAQEALLSLPVTGSGSGLTLNGVVNIRKVVATDNGVSAIGVLTGTVTDALGVTTSVVRTIALPIRFGDTTCDILHLDIGPISLDLLGLKVDLSRIVLDITAEARPGNLLGNLLCAVAGLLDDPTGLAKVLNQILALL